MHYLFGSPYKSWEVCRLAWFSYHHSADEPRACGCSERILLGLGPVSKGKLGPPPLNPKATALYESDFFSPKHGETVQRETVK